MAFTPFVETDLPSMANFNAKFEEAISAAKELALSEGVKIATGSYTGTGTYGAKNPNSLTFDFEPKVIMIHCEDDNYSSLPWLHGITDGAGINRNSLSANTISWNGYSISWYNTSSADAQFNAAKKYNFIAIC